MVALVGLDWGSSHLRAYAFDASGNVIERRSSERGAMTMTGRDQFVAALDDVLGNDSDWRVAPRIACGMVGARGAWIEAGYCDLGADASALADRLARVETDHQPTLWVVPGIASDVPDVMRGEETQLLGAHLASGTVVLPGTHSKWAFLVDGRIAAFRTYMTGELNALIRTHSTVGRTLAPTTEIEPRALAKALAHARAGGGFAAHLFSFRARAVARNEDAQALSNEFSAWLIATEFADALKGAPSLRELSLIGSNALNAWYVAIAEQFGLIVNELDADRCVSRGLWRIAEARGLVHPA